MTFNRTHCPILITLSLRTSLKTTNIPYISTTVSFNNGNIYGTQERKHIYALMDCGLSKNTTGCHIRDAIEAHNIEIGFSGLLFTNNLPALIH